VVTAQFAAGSMSGNSGCNSYNASSGVAALAGTWEVTGYYTGTAVQSPEVGSTLTADFTSANITGDAGCNTFNGPFEVTGSSITIGPLASTLKACASDALNTQEQHYSPRSKRRPPTLWAARDSTSSAPTADSRRPLSRPARHPDRNGRPQNA
jgi:heat shock protein HslJ